ncbi:hypothetical protein Pcinc_024621 [Petrolisthes cinctipes]|uniref:Uncharacterized protein n=1 Tax=Petrolisthes cinctipes TaxID=88211 RepID=A0AAE1F9K0_PETCI|nr:hypothetical protein Pcinc_024621 [Petrolisthes cinctipes]
MRQYIDDVSDMEGAMRQCCDVVPATTGVVMWFLQQQVLLCGSSNNRCCDVVPSTTGVVMWFLQQQVL